MTPRRILALLALLLAAACASGTGPAPSTVQVTADAYSGLPNPTWTLDLEQARDLSERLAELEPAEPAEMFEGLGYRGMVVAGVEAALGGCGELRVREGKAAARCPEGTRFYDDDGRALERWLAASGRAHLDGDTFRQVQDLVEP